MNESRHFPPEPASVTQARRFVVHALDAFSDDVIDNAELLVSELATNALRHTGSGFTVAIITTTQENVRIEVTDPGEGMPEKRHPAQMEPTGRGLHIVEALADHWEVTPASPTGKTVAFVLSGSPRQP